MKYLIPAVPLARATLIDVILITETAIAFQIQLGEHYHNVLGGTIESCLAEALGLPQHRCEYRVQWPKDVSPCPDEEAARWNREHTSCAAVLVRRHGGAQ